MIPSEPLRRSQLGFLYIPPYRVQGLSVAGEQTCVQVPELDVVFDIGNCPRAALTSNHLALTHGHMDHAAGIAYYFSQRTFQGMGPGTLICHPKLERPIHNVMHAWIDLEAQPHPYKVVPLEPDEEFQLKRNIYLRGVATNHTVPSLGYVVIERRSKLKPEFADLPQEQLVELKKQGQEITHLLEIPLVCCTGDTAWGPHFSRPDVLAAKILITECTFTDPTHRDRAHIGKHLHLEDVVRLLRHSQAEAVILTHLSRRTNMAQVRQRIEQVVPAEQRQRLFLLMDHRANRQRYEQQQREMQQQQQANSSAGS